MTTPDLSGPAGQHSGTGDEWINCKDAAVPATPTPRSASGCCSPPGGTRFSGGPQDAVVAPGVVEPGQVKTGQAQEPVGAVLVAQAERALLKHRLQLGCGCSAPAVV